MMKLTRQYFPVREACFGDCTGYHDGKLTISREGLQELVKPLMKFIKNVSFELVSPGEDTRIIHVLDTLQPMYKKSGNGSQYSGFFGDPVTTGDGVTNLLTGFSVMESAALPWDAANASSGLLYPRDAIIDMTGPIKDYTPFCDTFNLVIIYEVVEGKSSKEYDTEIRSIGIRVASYLASLTKDLTPESTEDFSIDTVDPKLPNVVLVWQCQNQGFYSDTFLYGVPIDDIVPTILHPNEMLDGCVVSGNCVWPAFKVPTYMHCNHPILLNLYRNHNKTLNFRGVIFCRSHQPSNWHKLRQANMNVKLAEYLGADGLVMAWEGGGNACVDGMLTVQCAEQHNIRSSLITFEFGGKDGTEGILLVDDVPEADAVISGGSFERDFVLPDVSRVVGGKTLRLKKEAGGFFPPAEKGITLETSTHIYMSGNQTGYSHITAEPY